MLAFCQPQWSRSCESGDYHGNTRYREMVYRTSSILAFHISFVSVSFSKLLFLLSFSPSLPPSLSLSLPPSLSLSLSLSLSSPNYMFMNIGKQLYGVDKSGSMQNCQTELQTGLLSFACFKVISLSQLSFVCTDVTGVDKI